MEDEYEVVECIVVEDEVEETGYDDRYLYQDTIESFESRYGPLPQKTNGKAIASMVLGLLSLFIFGIIFGVLAIVFGFQGIGEIRRDSDYYTGYGFALTGIIIGFIGIPIKLFIMLVIFTS